MAFRFQLESLIWIVITHGVFVDGGMLLKFGRHPLFFSLLLRFSSTLQSLEMMEKKKCFHEPFWSLKSHALSNWPWVISKNGWVPNCPNFAKCGVNLVCGLRTVSML